MSNPEKTDLQLPTTVSYMKKLSRAAEITEEICRTYGLDNVGMKPHADGIEPERGGRIIYDIRTGQGWCPTVLYGDQLQGAESDAQLRRRIMKCLTDSYTAAYYQHGAGSLKDYKKLARLRQAVKNGVPTREFDEKRLEIVKTLHDTLAYENHMQLYNEWATEPSDFLTDNEHVNAVFSTDHHTKYGIEFNKEETDACKTPDELKKMVLAKAAEKYIDKQVLENAGKDLTYEEMFLREELGFQTGKQTISEKVGDKIGQKLLQLVEADESPHGYYFQYGDTGSFTFESGTDKYQPMPDTEVTVHFDLKELADTNNTEAWSKAGQKIIKALNSFDAEKETERKGREGYFDAYYTTPEKTRRAMDDLQQNYRERAEKIAQNMEAMGLDSGRTEQAAFTKAPTRMTEARIIAERNEPDME